MPALEKAIEIKRRAQRCIQNGDLDGALNEYEKLVGSEDADPYNLVLIADLLYKKGDHENASRRYLGAAGAYEKAGLYKNAIAVCKKMMRLSLSPAVVLERLAGLHDLDGLSTEAALYFQQYAEYLVRAGRPADAARSLRKAFDACTENVRVLERLAEVYLADGKTEPAAKALLEAAEHYRKAGQASDAVRCEGRARQAAPGVAAGSAEGDAVGEQPAPDVPEPAGSATPDEVAAPTPPAQVAAGATPPVEMEPGLVIEPEPASMAAGEGPAPAAEEENEQPGEEELEGPPLGDGVIEIDLPGAEAAGAETAEAGAQIADRAPEQPAAEAPGLHFDSPAVPAEAAAPAGPDPMVEVERLLAEAQLQFYAGDRDAASETLARAASAYELLGRFDSAASIYRSLSRSSHAGPGVMTRWLTNCERRDDRREAAQVACELGDRALNDGEPEQAREWFERARAFDESNETARRRLQRLQGGAGPVATAESPAAEPPVAAAAEAASSPNGMPAPAQAEGGAQGKAEAPAAPAAGEAPSSFGRVEVAVGRSEAVTFDLGSLLTEFQRGVEAQLSGDAQSHYDLAMTYREMGLLEQAIESFRVAARDPTFACRAAEMVGRCLLDQGQFPEAVQEFGAALKLAGADRQSAVSVRYQLGLALEAAGRVPEALAEFEQVCALQADYPDAALKVRVLRKSLEQV